MTPREHSRGGGRRFIRLVFTRTTAVVLGFSLGLAAFSSNRLPRPSLPWQTSTGEGQTAPTPPAQRSSGDFALAAELDEPLIDLPTAEIYISPAPQMSQTPPDALNSQDDFPPLVISPEANLRPLPGEGGIQAAITTTLAQTPSLPPGQNPLTGLQVAQPGNLERRPLGIKITLFPRDSRPQWGVNLADVVYEYYLEHGMTRFFAVFYGQDAAKVGPVRSGRFFDEHLVRMYKSIFVFANADRKVLDHFLETELVNYFVVERPENCPPICRDRYTQGYNNLFTNTEQLTHYIREERGVENERQDLSGMVFDLIPPEGGIRGSTIATTYSTTSYNEWRYDPASGQYLRFQETENYLGGEELYAPLMDRLTETQISTENVVQLMVPHEYYTTSAEVVLMNLWGYGQAYVFRDGLTYQTYWHRASESDVLTLVNADGTPFPLKPGRTFLQVVGQTTQVWQFGKSWRFKFQIP